LIYKTIRMSEENIPEKKDRKKVYIILFFVALSLSLLGVWGVNQFRQANTTDFEEQTNTPKTDLDSTQLRLKQAEIEEQNRKDTFNINAISELSESIDLSKYQGKIINIAITGVDSRMGDRTKHADANHIFSLLLDSGKIIITSVPRDTYVDLGYEDSLNLNKLTICRASRSRETYLKELAKIAGLAKIDYYVEFGFAQAMGLIEFLGYSNPNATLQVLRSRKALGGDDYQRCYNQGQFMRQAILKNASKAEGLTGEFLIRGGLFLVESNLTTSIVKSLNETMQKNEFGKNPSDIKVIVKPRMANKFKVFDFTDQDQMKQLQDKAQFYFETRERPEDGDNKNIQDFVYRRLMNVLAKAAQDTAKKPMNSYNILKVYFEQRAWLQIRDIKQKDQVRDEFKTILSRSLIRAKKEKQAKEIIDAFELEKEYLKLKQ